jgi:hemerythrin
MDFDRDLHWPEDLSTAITFLDEEHRELMRRYRALVDALRSKVDSSRFLEDIEKLAEDTQAHFLHEERVMRNIQYPDYSEHKAAHDRLTADFSDFIQNIGVGFSDGDLPALTEYFRYWFMSHVKEHDVKLKHYVDRPDKQHESVPRRA